jgi:gamma-glutamyltranspeptidase/glutathione hydrolase
MRLFPASVAACGKPDGEPWIEGDRLVLPDLAASLRAIATDGPMPSIGTDRRPYRRGYGGARRSHDEGRPRVRAGARSPIEASFLGASRSMPPPSSGGVALQLALNMLESLGIQKTARLSPRAIHLEIEAMRRAFLDRARFLGDADFVNVPVGASSRNYTPMS